MSVSASREVLDSLAQFAVGLERLLEDIRGINDLGEGSSAQTPQHSYTVGATRLPTPTASAVQPRYGLQPTAPMRATTAASAAQAYHAQQLQLQQRQLQQQQQQQRQQQQQQQLLLRRRIDTSVALVQIRHADEQLRAAFRKLSALRRGQCVLECLNASFARRTSACVAAALFRGSAAYTRLGAALQTAVEERNAAVQARLHPVSAQRAVCVAGRVGSAASPAPQRARRAQGPYPAPSLVRCGLLLEHQCTSAPPAGTDAATAPATAPVGPAPPAVTPQQLGAAAVAAETEEAGAGSSVSPAAAEAESAAGTGVGACRKDEERAGATPQAVLPSPTPTPLPGVAGAAAAGSVVVDGMGELMEAMPEHELAGVGDAGSGTAGDDDDEDMGLGSTGLGAPTVLMEMNSIDSIWPMQ